MPQKRSESDPESSNKMELYTVSQWIKNKGITKTDHVAWNKFKGMCQEFAERGCSPGTSIKNVLPSLPRARTLPTLSDTNAYDVNGNIYICTTEEEPDIAGFATVYDFQLSRDAKTLPFYPDRFAYIAHLCVLPKNGRRLHQVLRKYFGETPFLVELGRNQASLASEAYMPYGFRPCMALDSQCDWARFLNFVMPLGDDNNPTKRASDTEPFIHGNIAMWMLQLPAQNPQGRFRKKLIAPALRSLEAGEQIAQHGPSVGGLLAQYTNNVISWITSGIKGARAGRHGVFSDVTGEGAE